MQFLKRFCSYPVGLAVILLASPTPAQMASPHSAVAPHPAATNKQQIHWAPNLETALRAARQFNVPVLVHLYGEDCLRCQIIEERVLSKPELIQTLNRFFICVKINGSENLEIMQKFSAHSYPTEVFLAPDGSVLLQDTPPDDLRRYEQRLTRVAFANRDRNAMLAAEGPKVNGTSAAVANAMEQNTNPATPSRTVTKSDSDSGSQPSTRVNFAADVADQPAESTSEDFSSGLSPSPQQHTPGSQHQLAAAVGPLGGQTATASWNQTPVSSDDQQRAKREKIAANTVVHPSATSSTPMMRGVATTSQPNLLSKTATRFGSQGAAAVPQTISNPYASPAKRQTASSPQSRVPAIAVSATQNVTNRPVSPHSFSVSEPSPESMKAPAFLDGYCPVALAREGKWLAGSDAYRVQHRGRIYRMSSRSAMDSFLATPDALSPVLSGYDPLILLEEGRLVVGSTQHALHLKETGECLLFSSAESKQRYWSTEEDFLRYSRALEALIEKSNRMR